MRCKGVATIIVYVPLEVSFPGAVRRSVERGGRVKSVNEDIRRFVVRAPLPEARRIIEDLIGYSVPRNNVSVEVNLLCRKPYKREPPAKARRVSRNVFVAICGGRLVLLEYKRDLLLAKIGRRKKIGIPSYVPGPGEFVLPELPGAEELEDVARCVLGDDA